MIRRFPASFSTPSAQFWSEACMMLDTKGCHELRDAFQFLFIWKEHFESKFGELQGISHLSNPDDPPDVIAHFSHGDVAIEITTIDPPHILQSDALHRKMGNERGRSEIPLSYKPKDRQEALEMMYCPGESSWENVSDGNKVWFDSITERVATKLSNSGVRHIQTGVILLPGRMNGSFGEVETVHRAFSAIRTAIPESEAWTLAICHQWNDLSYFSAVDFPGSGIEFKQKQG
jgi:hypothetical protein